MAATARDSVYDDPKAPLSRGADVALGASFMALFAGSAIYGFVHTGRCSRLKEAVKEEEPSDPEPPRMWSRRSMAPASPASSSAAPLTTSPPASAPEPAPTDEAPLASPPSEELSTPTEAKD